MARCPLREKNEKVYFLSFYLFRIKNENRDKRKHFYSI